MDYDFSGYVTKNDLRCADGRVIRHDAFKENDGQIVPLVWQHVHTDPTNVLGHALLENRDDGVYGYAKFNQTEKGQHAKEMVENGDIVSMSIYANRLKQHGSDVIHGVIREVSLVLAGANPGAFIDNISFAHADGTYTDVDDEAVIYSGLESIEYFSHADENEEDEVDDILDQLTDEQIDAINAIIDAALDDALDDLDDNKVLDDLTDEQLEAVGDIIEDAVSEALEHADDDEYDDDEEYDEDDDDEEYDEDDEFEHADGDTIEDIWNTLDEEQQDMVYYLIGQAVEQDNVEHGALYEGDFDMKHNVFDDAYYEDEMDDVLTHDEFDAIMEDAYNASSLRDVFLAHGITNLDVLFPEAKLVTPTPEMISRDMGWVDQLWNGIKRTPFARIKSTAANITGEEARARGYVKGNLKVEEVITLLSRETTPQTIYKKQKLDRDDVIDITDIDVIAWLKQEMRLMLNEEICRAILVGDGRNVNHPDKIKQDKVRPIYQDDNVYTIHYAVTYGESDTADQKASKLADAAVRSRKDYKGSGTPWLFASNETIADLILAKDTIGRRLYKDEDELKAALRVSKIVECPILENIQRTTGTGGSAKTWDLKALIFNPIDYTVGADKGGAVSLFDDFDIDYNQMKYLIETRISGALTKPYSAIALETQNFLNELSVAPMAGSENLWGTSVSDVQSNVVFNGNLVTGTLKHVASGALADGWGAGNFIAVDLSDNNFTGLTSVKVGMEPSAGAGLQEIINDPDKAGVFKVTDKYNQKLVVVQTNGKDTVTQKYTLSGLTLETA